MELGAQLFRQTRRPGSVRLFLRPAAHQSLRRYTEKREMKDTLICFDFQTPALERLCAGNVVFQWPGSSAVEEAIFDQHCSTSMSFVFLVINCGGRNREINPRSSRLVFTPPQERDRHMTTPIDTRSRALHRSHEPPLQAFPPRQPSRTSSNSVPVAFDTHVLTADRCIGRICVRKLWNSIRHLD